MVFHKLVGTLVALSFACAASAQTTTFPSRSRQRRPRRPQKSAPKAAEPAPRAAAPPPALPTDVAGSHEIRDGRAGLREHDLYQRRAPALRVPRHHG